MSEEIDLKFNDKNRERLYEGKRCTTRDEKKGDPGDWFLVDGQKFVVTHVTELRFVDIKNSFYEIEGFEARHELAHELESIYPDVNPLITGLWVHLFVKADLIDKEESRG